MTNLRAFWAATKLFVRSPFFFVLSARFAAGLLAGYVFSGVLWLAPLAGGLFCWHLVWFGTWIERRRHLTPEELADLAHQHVMKVAQLMTGVPIGLCGGCGEVHPFPQRGPKEVH